MLKWVFGADTGPFRQSLSQIRNETKAFAGGIKGMIAGMFGLAAINAMIEKISRISDISERLGMDPESFQRVEYAAGQAGVEVEGVAKALTVMQKNLAGAGSAADGMGDALATLGLDAGSFKEMSPEQQLVALSKGYTEAADHGQALAAVMKLMGKGGAEMATLLSEGPQALKAALDEANPATNEQVKNIENLGDKISKLKAQAVPVFASLVEGLMNIGPIIGWLGDTITQQFGTALDYVRDQFGTIGEIIKSTLTFNWDGQSQGMEKFAARRARMVDEMSKKQDELNGALAARLGEIHSGNGENGDKKNQADADTVKKSIETRLKLTEEIAKLEEESRLRQLTLEQRILDLKKQQSSLAADAIFITDDSALDARKKELEISKQIAELEKEKDATALRDAEHVSSYSKSLADAVKEEADVERQNRMAVMTDEEKIIALKKEGAELVRQAQEDAKAGDLLGSVKKRTEAKRVAGEIGELEDKGNKPPVIIADDLRKIGGGGNAVLSGSSPQAGTERRLDSVLAALRSIDSKTRADITRPAAFD